MITWENSMSLHAATTCFATVTFGNKQTQINAMGCSFPQLHFILKMLTGVLPGHLTHSSFRLI